jgi:hypothetical protein
MNISWLDGAVFEENDTTFELHSERIPVACCGVSERIKKQTEFLTVEDSLQSA